MKSVIFDLDGTLVDSVAAICDVTNVLLDELSMPAMSVEEARQYIGNGAEVFLQRTLSAREALIDPDQLAPHLQRFLKLYAEAPGDANRPFDGVDGALNALIEEGWTIGLCTNKPMAPTLAVIEALGWKNLFQTVIAGDSLPQRKPDPAPLIEAGRRLRAQEPIFVGDSEVDAETASAARLPFVLFTEGYRKSPVESLRHTAAFSQFGNLLQVLNAVAHNA